MVDRAPHTINNPTQQPEGLKQQHDNNAENQKKEKTVGGKGKKGKGTEKIQKAKQKAKSENSNEAGNTIKSDHGKKKPLGMIFI